MNSNEYQKATWQSDYEVAQNGKVEIIFANSVAICICYLVVITRLLTGRGGPYTHRFWYNAIRWIG